MKDTQSKRRSSWRNDLETASDPKRKKGRLWVARKAP